MSAKKKNLGGRPSIFTNKTESIHGRVSSVGRAHVDKIRAEVAAIVKWPIDRISYGDAIEYMARGRKASMDEWKKRGIL